MMSLILKGCSGVLCYIDDVIVWGRTTSEHQENLRRVLRRISEAGLQLNDKGVFDVDHLSFLGHVVGKEGLAPLHSKVEAIVQAPVPKDVSALRSFLGLAGYYSRFVPHYSDVVEPLRKLLRQSQAFTWDDASQRSFEKIKEVLSSGPVNKMFDSNLPVVVTTDASDTGLGAVLQQQAGQELHTVAFASRSLTSTERRYSAGEKEALACLFACEHWHIYLWGRRFLLRTDHQALVTLLSSRGSGRRPLRIARWSARLLYYNFDIVYQRGSDNAVADALSRLPLVAAAEPEMEEEVVSLVSSCMTKDQVQVATAKDSTLQLVTKYLEKGWPAKRMLTQELMPFFQLREELSMVEGIVFREDKVVVPDSLTSDLVSFAHEAHPGIVKTKQRLRDKFWWPRMDRQVECAVRSCHVCQSADKSAKPVVAPLRPVTLPEKPWQKLAMDIVGPLNLTTAGPKFVVTLVDYHSKWPEVCFANTVTSQAVIDFLRGVFSREGYPEELVTDNGPQFKSKLFEDFLNQRGIKHCVSSVYYPQANGLVERFNRSLKDFIQVSVLEGRPLKEAVVDYLGVYRSTPHSTTGVSPAQLLHGRQPRTRLDIMGLPSKNFFQEPATAMEQLRARVQSKQRSTKEYTDAKRSAKTPKFKEGDFVRVRKPTNGGKGELSYSRPLKIQKQVGPGTFRLEDGRSWNASKLVAVPEECVTERSKRLLHLLPVPGDQEQSARRTVSDNQGEYSVGENREALATPCQVSGGADLVDEHRLAASETPIQITIGPDSIEEQRREVLTSPVQVSQDECPVVGLRLEDSAAPTQAQGTTWSDGPCRGPSTRERRRPSRLQDFHIN